MKEGRRESGLLPQTTPVDSVPFVSHEREKRGSYKTTSSVCPEVAFTGDQLLEWVCPLLQFNALLLLSGNSELISLALASISVPSLAFCLHLPDGSGPRQSASLILLSALCPLLF